ncbi:hypothetical protein [Phenylobacterium sp.]|jgi:uncharacterized protein YecT (DUF1311 family)|uniref:hypothetical protein n=1 Tax=Phenylobacterium sp. TaxID=1871053 RepID=UPI002EDA9A3B
MPSDPAERRPFDGFSTYADDSPREVATIDAPEGPLMAGWAETPPWRQMGAEDEPPRSWPKIAAVAGAAMGVAAAVAVGWSAVRRPDAAPVAAPTPARASAPLQVVITDPPPPPPVPRSAERLDVLPKPAATPPPQVRLARAMIPVLPEPGVVVREQPDDPLPAPSPLPPPSVGEAAQVATAVVTPAPRRFNDCADAPTRAMALVCRDMRLAEADRRMKRAYRAALAAGVPADELARDQADWLDVREEAAQVSRRAVADIYHQRIRELRAMADDGRD